MITLITGVPGAGKTLYAVDQILQPEAKAGRQLFVDGIPDLLITHEPAPDPLEWHKWAPEGAHIVIDEVQRVWRPEAAGRAIPESIAQLETHRHRGLDFTIMTQHPSLIHSNVRRLVGRHIHVRRTALGVYVYEYPECMNSPDTAYKSALTKVRWPHPKRSFGAYKSASIHQKVKFRIPRAAIVFVACICLIGGLGFYLYNRVVSPSSVPVTAAAPSSNLASTQPVQSSGARVNVVDEPDIREQFIPRVYGEPATAPAYDHLRQVVTMPFIAACIADADRCLCYTQQMTKVDMTDSQCRQHATRGVFDPYRDATKERTVRGEHDMGSDEPTQS
ncbi:zonular occludens toxin domain-containing protein [Aeromonas caviae]|uniref:zonular occludens toxin domain-containing protein n=1 Tax=Aeromonas caviae TaxID=648 RepID=UPI0029D9AFAA|nr:zonular occludens toxin domain-containing protein [Aeromonas caviae]MDX7728752.1 zonular occludens toxin domain-containing protein [Aeromonas caviae]